MYANVRTITTPYFTLSVKYVSAITLEKKYQKRFFRSTVYTITLKIYYYNEMGDGKIHIFENITYRKKEYLKNLEESERMKKYIEMDMGSSYFPVEYKQKKQQESLFSLLRKMR
jgi:hypothetical protein